ncbi:SDR family NAD(P)-dependent oxidoreductase [Phenylobacterium sp.]|uniref:SDR family NAD(P)-dependent oxidoreductase n=1 Tax=Phenylobacterium sp. TaxID=1871053 RepID=UPI0025F98A8F|nr:SDR family NAD(P)-dependent oxidoreductase [Phenylobacterium sp.]
MPKTIVIIGFGPGVSTGMADWFGARGFSVALVARNADRLVEGLQALKARGVVAAAFPADAGDPAAIRAAIAKARDELGQITVLHWNAFRGVGAVDLVAADPAAVRSVFDVAIVGLLAAVQESLPDLKASGEGAVLITNGALGDLSPMMDQFAIGLDAVGVALGNAAKDKLAGLLAARLAGEGVYVGEVIIAGAIKGTPTGNDLGISPSTVAEAFWTLYQARSDLRARVS